MKIQLTHVSFQKFGIKLDHLYAIPMNNNFVFKVLNKQVLHLFQAKVLKGGRRGALPWFLNQIESGDLATK